MFLFDTLTSEALTGHGWIVFFVCFVVGFPHFRSHKVDEWVASIVSGCFFSTQKGVGAEKKQKEWSEVKHFWEWLGSLIWVDTPKIAFD